MLNDNYSNYADLKDTAYTYTQLLNTCFFKFNFRVIKLGLGILNVITLYTMKTYYRALLLYITIFSFNRKITYKKLTETGMY